MGRAGVRAPRDQEAQKRAPSVHPIQETPIVGARLAEPLCTVTGVEITWQSSTDGKLRNCPARRQQRTSRRTVPGPAFRGIGPLKVDLRCYGLRNLPQILLSNQGYPKPILINLILAHQVLRLRLVIRVLPQLHPTNGHRSLQSTHLRW